MARLPYLDAADLAPGNDDLLRRPINLHRQLAHSPGLLRAFSGMGQYIRHGGVLDPRLRELAILQVGWVARAPYEWSHHVKIGFDFGVTEADVRALMDDSEGRPTTLGAAERAVLQAARHLSNEPSLPDPLFDALRPHFNEAALVELVVVIGFYAGVVRILASLQIDVEPEYVTFLERFPLPAKG